MSIGPQLADKTLRPRGKALESVQNLNSEAALSQNQPKVGRNAIQKKPKAAEKKDLNPKQNRSKKPPPSFNRAYTKHTNEKKYNFKSALKIVLVVLVIIFVLKMLHSKFSAWKAPEQYQDDNSQPSSAMDHVNSLYYNKQFKEAMASVNTILFEEPTNCAAMFAQALIRIEMAKESKNINLIHDANENFMQIFNNKKCSRKVTQKSLAIISYNYAMFDLNGMDLIHNFETISAKRPQNIDIHNYFAMFYIYTGRYNEAFVHLNKVIQMSENDVFSHLLLSIVYHKSKNYLSCFRSLEFSIRKINNLKESHQISLDSATFYKLHVACAFHSTNARRAQQILDDYIETDIFSEKDKLESFAIFQPRIDFQKYV